MLDWIMNLGTKSYKRFNGKRAVFVNPGFKRGTWGMIAATAITTGGSMYMQSKAEKGKGEERQTYNLPDFPEDKYYKQAQDILYPAGRDLLAGKPSEYYKPIGEIGGELFEDVLGMGKKDITTSITEDMARRNIRGIRGSGVIGKAVGEYTKKARFDDYMRALEGRKFMLGTGASITSGVRSGALTSQGQKATYEVSKGNLALGYAGLASREAQAKGEAMGEGIGGGISGLANIYAMGQLGRVDPGTSSVYNTGGNFRDITMMQNIPSSNPYAQFLS